MHHPKLATLCSLAGVLAAAAAAMVINAELLSNSAPPAATRVLPTVTTAATTLPATTTTATAPPTTSRAMISPSTTAVATTEPRPTTSPTTSSTTPQPHTRPDPTPSSTSSRTVPPHAAATATLPERYTVVAGDCWSCIADRLGVDIDDLLAANGATAVSELQPGQVLAVPVGGVLPLPDASQPDSPPPAAGSPNQASYLLGLAGSAVLDRSGGVLQLVSITPSQDWTVASSGNDGPTTVVIELTSTGGQTARFTATLVRGVVVLSASGAHDGPAGGDRPVGPAPSASVTLPTQPTPPERSQRPSDVEGRSDDDGSADEGGGNDGDPDEGGGDDGDRGAGGGRDGDRGGRGGRGGDGDGDWWNRGN